MRKTFRVLSLILVLLGVFALLAPSILPLMLPIETEAASVAIIGGADGPTAIYVSGWPDFTLIGWGMIALGAAGIFLTRKKKN